MDALRIGFEDVILSLRQIFGGPLLSLSVHSTVENNTW